MGSTFKCVWEGVDVHYQSPMVSPYMGPDSRAHTTVHHQGKHFKAKYKVAPTGSCDTYTDVLYDNYRIITLIHHAFTIHFLLTLSYYKRRRQNRYPFDAAEMLQQSAKSMFIFFYINWLQLAAETGGCGK